MTSRLSSALRGQQTGRACSKAEAGGRDSGDGRLSSELLGCLQPALSYFAPAEAANEATVKPGPLMKGAGSSDDNSQGQG